MKDDSIQNLTFEFAVRIVALHRHLKTKFQEYDIARQILRSGTSPAANVAEAQEAQSRADFISKMSIALKEANETDFWLRLLRRTNYITEAQFQSIMKDCKVYRKTSNADNNNRKAKRTRSKKQ